MRNVFPRRDFPEKHLPLCWPLAAGVLTGCDGAAARSRPQPSGWVEFEVTMTGNMTITGDEVGQ